MDLNKRGRLDPAALKSASGMIAGGLMWVFIVMLVFAIVQTFATFFMSGRKATHAISTVEAMEAVAGWQTATPPPPTPPTPSPQSNHLKTSNQTTSSPPTSIIINPHSLFKTITIIYPTPSPNIRNPQKIQYHPQYQNLIYRFTQTSHHHLILQLSILSFLFHTANSSTLNELTYAGPPMWARECWSQNSVSIHRHSR